MAENQQDFERLQDEGVLDEEINGEGGKHGRCTGTDFQPVLSVSGDRDEQAVDAEMGYANDGGTVLGKNNSGVYAEQWDLIHSQLAKGNIGSPLFDGVKWSLAVQVV
jgi:hypothetical protein